MSNTLSNNWCKRWRSPRCICRRDNYRSTAVLHGTETFLQGTTSNERLHRYLPAMPRQNGPQHMAHSFLRDSPRLGGNCCKTRETHRRTRAERATNSHHRTQGHCTTCRWQHRPRLGTCRLKRCITRTLTPKLPAVPCQRRIPCTQLQPLRCTCPADTVSSRCRRYWAGTVPRHKHCTTPLLHRSTGQGGTQSIVPSRAPSMCQVRTPHNRKTRRMAM